MSTNPSEKSIFRFVDRIIIGEWVCLSGVCGRQDSLSIDGGDTPSSDFLSIHWMLLFPVASEDMTGQSGLQWTASAATSTILFISARVFRPLSSHQCLAVNDVDKGVAAACIVDSYWFMLNAEILSAGTCCWRRRRWFISWLTSIIHPLLLRRLMVYIWINSRQ